MDRPLGVRLRERGTLSVWEAAAIRLLHASGTDMAPSRMTSFMTAPFCRT